MIDILICVLIGEAVIVSLLGGVLMFLLLIETISEYKKERMK